MLDDVLNLTPHVEFSLQQISVNSRALPATDPPIFIPAIATDGTLYPVEKIKAHRDGLHHLALSIFVFDGDDLLIQQRAKSKYHCAGQWANTCCTHPNMGETLQDAAQRRLKEELGFSIAMQETCTVDYSADVGNGLWERERVTMFRAEGKKHEIAIRPNPDEVEKTRWINVDELRADVLECPHHYTPWFRIYMARFPTFQF